MSCKPAVILSLFVAAVTMASTTPARAEYDYHHASACQGNEKDGTYLDTPLGVIRNTNPNSLVVDIICPIPRIYPRRANRLTRVAVHLHNYSDPNRGPGAVVAVCAQALWRSEPKCISKPALYGTQELVFEQRELAQWAIEPEGADWDTFLYIKVQQRYKDEMSGYILEWDFK